MFQTIIVYVLIYFCTLTCSKYAKTATINSDRSFESVPIFYLGIIIFSLIVGLRWNVGIDYPAYYDILKGYNIYEIQLERLELIPKVLIKLVQSYNLPFYLWFIVMAFVQMYFLQKTFGRDLKQFVVWGVFFFLSLQLAHAMNIIRHIAALTIVLYAYSFLIKKEYIKSVLWILFASLFHTSAFVGIPILLLSNFKISFNQIVQIAIVLFFFVFGEQIIKFVTSTLFSYADSYKYLFKLEKELLIEQGTNLGVIFHYMRYLILILYSIQLSKEYGKYGFDIFYTISFIGICLYKASMYDMILSRVVMYFSIASIVCLAMLMVYLYKKSNNPINKILLAGLTILQVFLTAYSVLNGGIWEFVWDAHNII